MKNTTSVIIAVLFAVLWIGCKSDTEKKNTSENAIVQTDSVAITNNDIDTSTAEYEASDDDIQEFGIIERIEDGAYPFYVVSVNFVERNMKHDFNLNIEAISLDVESLNNLEGKYATIFYTSELENRLIDLHYEGASLFGEYAPEYDSSWKNITGTLSGADEATPGDLPDVISITAGDEKMDFELFIDPETVTANGKMVTAYYYIRGVETITNIRPSEE